MSDIQFTPAYLANNPLPDNSQLKSQKKFQESFKRMNTLFSEKFGQFSDYVANTTSTIKTKKQISFNKFRGYFKKSYVLPAVIVLVVLVGIYMIGNPLSGNSSSVLSDADQRVSLKKPKAQQVINKEFLFPLKDEKGKEVSKIKYYIQDAQLQDEIVVKGQRATAVKGRTFLIIYLKITNDFNQDISLKSRDYVRLMVNNSTEKLAPDIHNDPVEIQAISTKYTRLGFPINDSDTNLILQIGEITGNKQNIKLDKLK